MELSELSLFKGATERECYQMMNCLDARIAHYGNGEIVLSLGDGRGRVGVVREGLAHLIRIDQDGNQTLLEALPEDSIFGEALAFSGARGDSLYVISQGQTSVLFIDYAHITKRCKNACTCHAQLIENILRLISTKALALGDRIEVLSSRNTRAKLMCFFQMTAAKHKTKTFRLPFDFSGLSEYICVDRSAMTREITKLKQEGLIKVEKKTITLLCQPTAAQATPEREDTPTHRF